MSEKSVWIEGVEIAPEYFPHLYSVAKRSPEGLAINLRELAQKAGNSDLRSVATTLEHDLEHELRGAN